MENKTYEYIASYTYHFVDRLLFIPEISGPEKFANNTTETIVSAMKKGCAGIHHVGTSLVHHKETSNEPLIRKDIEPRQAQGLSWVHCYASCYKWDVGADLKSALVMRHWRPDLIRKDMGKMCFQPLSFSDSAVR